MGLHQRNKHIRFQFPEWVLIVLIVFTISSGVVCLVGLSLGTWKKTTAHITGVRSASTASASAISPGSTLHVQFRYSVKGVVYRGEKTLSRMSQWVMGALPKRIRDRLAAQGMLTFADVPEEIRTVLARKGMTSLEEAPETLLRETARYKEESDVPDELKTAGRNKDYATLANALDEAVPDASRAKSGAVRKNTTGASSESYMTALTSSLPNGAGGPSGQVVVYYNPVNPSQYAVRMLGVGSGWAGLFFLVCGTLGTLFYGTRVYPRLKQRR